MLNFLSAGNQKQVVGIALTPGIGLEAVILDRNKSTILNYGQKKVEYNFSTREIQDYVQFKTALVELMDEMKIAPKSFVYLVLPNVYFDFLEIPPMISNPEIKTAILSKAEEFYIFKRDEPVSGWCEIINLEGGSQKKLAYASFQKSTVDEIKEIISDVGLQLVGIESSYSATLRGLYVTGYISDVVLEEASWTAMLINTNSYTLFQMDGKNLVNYNEVPLAIKSFSMEEAYQTIVSSSSQFLSNFSSTNLYIISQTDDICAEVLKRQLQFDREIIAIDSNKYSKKPLMEVMSATDFNAANSVTLATIGAACTKTDFNLILNVLQDDPNANMGVYFTTKILGNTVEVTSNFVDKLAILIVAVCAIIFGALIGLLYFLDIQSQNNISEINNQIQSIDAQINAESKTEKKVEIDMNMVIDEVAALNVTAINFYDSIATDIPKNVWLTKYYNKAGNQIAIRGIAESIIDIYEYYKNLRIVSPQSDIKLTELKVVTENSQSQEESNVIKDLAIDNNTDRLYSFEISNTEIQFSPKKQDKEDVADENEIIPRVKTENIEQPSKQMKPTN